MFLPPNLNQMLEAYQAVKEKGLRQVRIGNLGVFARTQEEMGKLLACVPKGV